MCDGSTSVIFFRFYYYTLNILFLLIISLFY